MFDVVINFVLTYYPIILAFYAGAAAMFALVFTLVLADEPKPTELPKHRMEIWEDSKYIDEALAIANS
jgi:hypothetical protein